MNVIKPKKILKYFLKIMGWEILEYSEFTCMKNSERRSKLSDYFWVSEKCSNSYKNYRKNLNSLK